MKQFFPLLTVWFTFFHSCSKQPDEDYTRYVDPYIGTGYHGHVFLGAHVPFGAVQAGPTNYVKGWDWCSGYHYSDSILTGFSQQHLSGTGIGDLGDVLITPFTGEIKSTPGNQQEPLSGYASLYSHSDETAQAGYYAVTLKRYGIRTEITATERVAFHRYIFPEDSMARVAVNLEMGIGWDRPVLASLRKISDDLYVGCRFSNGWAKDQRVYFAIQLSQAVDSLQLFEDQKAVEGDSASGSRVVGVLTLSAKKERTILLKIGLSPVSEENALQNIKTEIPHWDFDKVAANARKAWNKELGRVVVKSKNEHDLRTFYTALYHAFTHPVLFNDNNGDYRGADYKVHKAPGFNNYSVFSLWDTYRAAHPLYTLIQPQRVPDMINSMLNIYQQQGKLPIWHLMGNETDCMVGYSAIPVIADAYFKGFKGFDPELALEAMKASSTRDDFGMKFIKEKGYIPADLEKESVSKAMEYAISDWCIAQMAKALGKNDDFEYYSGRARAYEQYFDPKSQFIRAKLDNGRFREPFSPFQSIHEWGDYTEGNAWQYTWLVPHDVEGLIRLFGGDEPFISKLDSLFVAEGDMGEHASSDISGLIGQYAHGNEPSHHITYMYAYAGQQWKTAEKNRFIQRSLYTDKNDGLCGNEDCGQMSAWYIFSSLGFYPANPANGAFVFGSPLFDEVTVNVPGNKKFTLVAHNNSEKNIYIQSAKLNGKNYTRSFITYKDIMSGGKLELEMGPQPNRQFGSAPEDRPASKIYN